MTQDISAPIWRERVNLKHTLKDGWRVEEVTVEVTYQDGNNPPDIERVNRLKDAVSRGQEAADEWNGMLGET